MVLPYCARRTSTLLFPSFPPSNWGVALPALNVRASIEAPSEGARSASTESDRPLPHHRRPMMMNQQPLIPDPLEEICG